MCEFVYNQRIYQNLDGGAVIFILRLKLVICDISVGI